MPPPQTADGLSDQEDIFDEELPEEGLHLTEPLRKTSLEERIEHCKAYEKQILDNSPDGHLEAFNSGIQITTIARPEESTSGFYTGVTHFAHRNNPSLVTFLFSAGRHNGGTNTWLTIDTTKEKPFEGAQETFIDKANVATWTWVSACSRTETDGSVDHYVLFSGGDAPGRVQVFPSTLYIFGENDDGSLRRPRIAWKEPTPERGARYCLVKDLGNIYDDGGNKVSIDGVPDIVITGTAGLDIYSNTGEGWVKVRNIDLAKLENTDGASFFGDQVIDKQYIVVAVRASWRLRGERKFIAPSYVYDYQNDKIVEEFAHRGQSTGAALLDNNKRVLLGSGGNVNIRGQPNIVYDVVFDDGSENKLPSRNLRLVRSEMQLLEGMSTEFQNPMQVVDGTPTAELPAEGHSKTRQVLAFRVEGLDADLVLEINVWQTCNILCRPNAHSYASKVIQLPGSEGAPLSSGTPVMARAGDVLEVNGTLHVVVANFNGNNTVYSFGTDCLKTF